MQGRRAVRLRRIRVRTTLQKPAYRRIVTGLDCSHETCRLV